MWQGSGQGQGNAVQGRTEASKSFTKPGTDTIRQTDRAGERGGGENLI